MQSSRPGSRGLLGSSARSRSLRLAGPAVVILLWWAVSSAGIVPPLKLPSPQRVVLAIQDIGQELLLHASATLARVLVGYFVGCLLGLFIGILMQFSHVMYSLLDGIVETWRPVPPVALVPFFILWFGFSESGKVLLVALGTSLIITVTVIEALERVPAGYIRWGLVLNLKRHHLFRRILLPAAVPDMRGGFRIALALAVTLVIVSEFMGARLGLGYLINVSKVTLSTPTILLGILVTGWMAWCLDRMLRAVFDRLSQWDQRARSAIQ